MTQSHDDASTPGGGDRAEVDPHTAVHHPLGPLGPGTVA